MEEELGDIVKTESAIQSENVGGNGFQEEFTTS